MAARIVRHVNNCGMFPLSRPVNKTCRWYGLYAATRAGQEGYTDNVLMLLVHVKPGADQLNPLFGPALISAVRNNREEMVVLLLDQGLDPNWHTP